MRRMAGAVEQDQLGAGVLGEGDPATCRADGVLFSVYDQDRAADASREFALLTGVQGGRQLGQRDHFAGRFEAPADSVLNRLGRVRLGEHPRHEEVQKARIVA